MTAEKEIELPAIASNKYLEDLTNSIRGKSIPWENYQRASLITENELIQLRQYEKDPPNHRYQYIPLFLSLLNKLVRNDTIQGILVLLDDVLTFAWDNCEMEKIDFVNNNFSVMLKLLRKDDEFVQLKTAKILVLVITEVYPIPVNSFDLVTWISLQLLSQNVFVKDIAIQLLQSLLSVSECRKVFFNDDKGLKTLLEILKGESTAQVQYQVIYCFWMLTFDSAIVKDLQKKCDIIPLCIEIAKSAIKEKVVRVILSTFRNMFANANAETTPFFISYKLLPLLSSLLLRKWSDTEITEDLEFLSEEISKSVQSLSTFDEYVTELKSGKLDWSPPHLSDQFWKSNVQRFNERDYELVRLLSRVMATSEDKVVLAVAVHDVGQYVKYYSNGKKIVQEIGLKQQIMELMSSPDADVRYQALMAVQKLLVGSWDM
ncbi:H(+)-transporting V1 sector ATPase subunit H [Nowakowskiella sp. JEL0407]|nr:H(+)-transporting V1 sector ATPase subunit H [Nowakowskiella sp. JEL0407]